MVKHVSEPDGRGKEHDDEQSDRGEKFAEDDLHVRDWRSHQQLHGSAPSFLGVNAHGQHGRKKKQERRQHAEEAAHDQGRNIESCPSSELPFLQAGFEGSLNVQSQKLREEICRQNEKNGDDDVSHRRNEVVAHLLAVNGVHSFHSFSVSV